MFKWYHVCRLFIVHVTPNGVISVVLAERTLAVVLGTLKAFAAVGGTARDAAGIDWAEVCNRERNAARQIGYRVPGWGRPRLEAVDEAALEHRVADEGLPRDGNPWPLEVDGRAPEDGSLLLSWAEPMGCSPF